jgi:NADH dehydrogenase/NADH:ubiquinone reductase (non-electrogenic)
VILGSGWSGHTLARRLCRKGHFDVRVISPSNHFLFTPLLPSTAVGTLEFRAIIEPCRTIPGLAQYYQAKAVALDTTQQQVLCADVFQEGRKFAIPYDYLVVAAGNKTNTFQTPGVAEREGREVFFLKHLYHARQIRNRVLECFERASQPSISEQDRDRLLSFVMVGGGPTSCEFTTELYDFLQGDVKKWFPDLIPHIKVTLVEAGPGLLGSFHKSLADYYLKSLKKRKIDVRLSTSVVAVKEGYYDSPTHEKDVIIHSKGEGSHYTAALLADGTELPFGAMVWSAGLAPVKLVEDAGLELQRGRIVVDDYLRVPGTKGRVYAAGDCATLRDGPLPPTASVAEQQAYYLGECFNTYYSDYDVNGTDSEGEVPLPGPVVPALIPWENLAFLNTVLCKSAPIFQYKNRGAMAGIGFGDAVTDLTNTDLPSPRTTMSGWAAFLTWRGVYLTKQLSWSNMMLIPMVRNPSGMYNVTHV